MESRIYGYLLAIPLGAVAISFRLRIPETPSFEISQQKESDPTIAEDSPFARQGLVGIVRHHGKSLLIAIALVAATNSAGYALTSYVPTYLEREVGVSNLFAAVATGSAANPSTSSLRVRRWC